MEPASRTSNITDAANRRALQKLLSSEPVVIGVKAAGEAVQGFSPSTILTSGPPLRWDEYFGGQRDALIGGALYEGLASTADEATAKFADGTISIGSCHDFGCVGSVAGIYTYSMPVFVVRNCTYGNIGYCNLYEGKTPKRLNYGVYDPEVKQRLDFLKEEVAPILDNAIALAGGIALKPIMRRALVMGDELHSRNTAASHLFASELFPSLLDLESVSKKRLKRVLSFLTEDNYFFLRLSMAAAKATADAARGVQGSSVVTAMSLNCRSFAIRMSATGDRWFSGPHATVAAKLFEGFTLSDIAWMGGESVITETIGLGGFAQACAPALQDYQGGSVETMISNNLDMYKITVGENDTFLIPQLGFRGTPTGIDVRKVVETGITPVIDAGIGGKGGGQIGAGIIRAPLPCFEEALAALNG